MSNPFKSFAGKEIVSTIMDALREVGYPVPDGAERVTLDSEAAPTYIKIDGEKTMLSDEDRALVVRAIQLHHVRHVVGTSAKR